MDELESLRESDDALDQSIALNRIVMTMLESKRREDTWLRILLIISLLVNVIISCIFITYESQFTTTTTTEKITIEQDTGEGSGNNVYQGGEYAQYIQGEGVTPNGEANSADSEDDNNENAQPGEQDFFGR